MLRLTRIPLPIDAVNELAALQKTISDLADYADRVKRAQSDWKAKDNTIAGKKLFLTVRSVLADECLGSVRCIYCEDSAADEIEHISPKSFFPEMCFEPENLTFACGPCNGPKGNQYAYWNGTKLVEVIRRRRDIPTPPPVGESGLVDPVKEDPTHFFELDLGGRAADGRWIDGTFMFLIREGLSDLDAAKAEFTIRILKLNRDILTASRRNAFGGFRARLREYVESKERGATNRDLKLKIKDLFDTPHLTVFDEMRRKRLYFSEIQDFINRAPEIDVWEVA